MSAKYFLKVQKILQQEKLVNTSLYPSVENYEALIQYEFRRPGLTIDDFYNEYTNGTFNKYLKGRQDRMRFYSSAEWRALKKIALSIYGSKCMVCGSTKDINVDHLVSRQIDKSKELDINNLGVLCETHNLEYSYFKKEDYRRPEDLEKLKQYLLKSA
jgi:hypothetical protein